MPLTNSNTWIRAAYMLLFCLLLAAARLVVSLVIAVQFVFVLVAGSDNNNLRKLGQGLGKWIYQALMFLTFNSDEKPFPFDEWPTTDVSEGYSVRPVETVEDAVIVESEELVNDDIPSFTADERDRGENNSEENKNDQNKNGR